MESFDRIHARKIQEIIPESQSELLGRILPMAVQLKEDGELPEQQLTEFCYLLKIWRDREVLWAQYPAGLLACKTVGQLVDYLYKLHQHQEEQRDLSGRRRARALRRTTAALALAN